MFPSKRVYIEDRLRELPEDEIPPLCERSLPLLSTHQMVLLQNALWHHRSGGEFELSVITRRALADWLGRQRLHPRDDPAKSLAGITAIDSSKRPQTEFFYDKSGALVRRELDLIHFWTNKEYRETAATHHDLLEEHGFESWPDRRVIQFLEYLVDPSTRTGADQKLWVDGFNPIIAADGYQLTQTSSTSSHPVFTVVRLSRSGHTSPKNLVFASNGPKPRLGFSDALDNDIVILDNQDHCLFYNEPIGDDGLTWRHLVGWWARIHGLDEPQARSSLGQRLGDALGSPPERALFAAYFRQYQKTLGDRLPALLPQVYLHYDPMTLRQLRERGLQKRFLTQRMDFLMLLPGNARVVLEVDGQQHYATDTGPDAQPSPRVYAETMLGDRDLRLAGYDVYRFGGFELSKASASATVRSFFDRLFARYKVH